MPQELEIQHLFSPSMRPCPPCAHPSSVIGQGQVTRAQEAEENYLVKRELATVKQQNEDTGAQLEQAHNTIRQLQQQQPHAVRTVCRHGHFWTRGRDLRTREESGLPSNKISATAE